jgi:methanogenic corrinoid protein MtbC1
MSTENLINEPVRSVVAGGEDAALKVADTVIAEGLNPIEIISAGFAQGMIKVNADIVAASALMTTTMVAQKLLHESLQEAGIREKVKLMVGGAAVTQEWADQIGADGYAEEVTAAIKKAKRLLR